MTDPRPHPDAAPAADPAPHEPGAAPEVREPFTAIVLAAGLGKGSTRSAGSPWPPGPSAPPGTRAPPTSSR